MLGRTRVSCNFVGQERAIGNGMEEVVRERCASWLEIEIIYAPPNQVPKVGTPA